MSKFKNLSALNADPSLVKELEEYGVKSSTPDMPAILREKARIKAEKNQGIVEAAAREAIELDALAEQRITALVKHLRELRAQAEKVKQNLAVMNLAQEKAAQGDYEALLVLSQFEPADLSTVREINFVATYTKLLNELNAKDAPKPVRRTVAKKTTRATK